MLIWLKHMGFSLYYYIFSVEYEALEETVVIWHYTSKTELNACLYHIKKQCTILAIKCHGKCTAIWSMVTLSGFLFESQYVMKQCQWSYEVPKKFTKQRWAKSKKQTKWWQHRCLLFGTENIKSKTEPLVCFFFFKLLLPMYGHFYKINQ